MILLHDRSDFTDKLIDALGIPPGTRKAVITIEVGCLVEVQLWGTAIENGEFQEGKKFRLIEIEEDEDDGAGTSHNRVGRKTIC